MKSLLPLLYRNTKLRLVLLAGLALCLIAGGLAVWSMAQPASPGPAASGLPAGETPSIDPALKRELALLAIHDPVAFEAELKTVKTAEDIQAEDIAAFALLNPKAYSAEAARFKTPEQLQREALSRMAVLEPKKYNAALEPLKTPEQREYEARAAFEILNPRSNSAITPNPDAVPAQP